MQPNEEKSLKMNSQQFLKLCETSIGNGNIPVIAIMLHPSGCLKEGVQFVSGLTYQRAQDFLIDLVHRMQPEIENIPAPRAFAQEMSKKLVGQNLLHDEKQPFEVEAKDEVKWVEGSQTAEEVLANMRKRNITPNVIAGCSPSGIEAYFFLHSQQVKEYLVDLVNWWDKHLMQERETK